MNGVGIILLAAGGSTRLGSPKQLIDVDGEPLVRVLARRLLELQPTTMCVVLGSRAEVMRGSVSDLPVEIVQNEAWTEGIGTSISAGVRWVAQSQACGTLIALCDQPAIPDGHFRALCDRFDPSQFDVVASEYAGGRGVPAVFSRTLFARLGSLSGDRGAKHLLQDPLLRITSIPCEQGRIDLDTPDDVDAFRSGDRA